MAYDVKESTAAPGGAHATMKAPTPPKLSDYDLTDVRISRAANGVSVECEHCLKPEVEKAMKAKNGKDHYLDYDIRRKSEKFVFNDLPKAAEFIEARLLGKDYATPEKAEAGAKVKVKVKE